MRPPLYSTLFFLFCQGLDVSSTFRGLSLGLTEGNPAVSGLLSVHWAAWLSVLVLFDTVLILAAVSAGVLLKDARVASAYLLVVSAVPLRAAFGNFELILST